MLFININGGNVNVNFKAFEAPRIPPEMSWALCWSELSPSPTPVSVASLAECKYSCKGLKKGLMLAFFSMPGASAKEH